MSKKKIIFRADGNTLTGLGHLYRLFALVEMLKDEYDYVFLTQSTSTIEVIPEHFNIRIIPNNISINNEPNWLSKEYSFSEHLIIADGYQFNSEYQKKIKYKKYKLVYIDDLGTEKMYADIVVNHSPYIKEDHFIALPNTKFALGTQYAILRPLFLKVAKKVKKIKIIKNVFICFGGSDFHDITNICVEGIIGIKNIKNIHIVLGGAYKHKSILKTVQGYEERVFLYKNLSERQMVEIMSKCQLAIVPSSTISYEVCSVKMLIYGGYYVDNQISIYKGFQEKQMIFDAENFNKKTPVDFKWAIEEILKTDPIQYQDMINKQHAFFDGNQKIRFQQLIKELYNAS
ncbi:UDP-2,4-diacetamido-2,4,6-trideoxy-beta-L-altropyranose hydrolase [Mariniflexile litorale]|uniref:UDP-2,4-diacetamido-2,4, 6-trideoxy-beta-L-altropyranose hydrolase n=1 Tax=Mariniflexile litorale TaxID=3045158 RepID=A0AAU7EKZ9_9FLAO|nr:UDP-2,4-diacetamido-2,4,6-trideoxy-beta-L-altropyranose hydrolase [Mariniflexile sp. KMM 9835]MDQ8211334.1 UDP-2,4-diacetamido-2,4,6-trideoxy-beta-L-altropyranose hydrolase [Mariniflexile sp. KMM 9835]